MKEALLRYGDAPSHNDNGRIDYGTRRHENGESVHIHPLESQIDDLVAAGHLVRDGNLYRLP